MSRRILLTVLLALLLLPGLGAAREALTLRVNDAIGEPGGLVAVVIRTYASRPVGQGQICFLARSRVDGAPSSPSSPFASLEETRIFSRRGDAVGISSLRLAGESQEVFVELSSESASINRKDGPLAVLFFRLRDDVEPRQRFTIEIDTANTLLLDAKGEVIEIEPRAGELELRRPGAAFSAEAEDDEVEPGERAELGMETYEPVAMASGQIGLRFEPDVVGEGRIRVRMRKQHGKRRFRADRSTPGLVLVSFESADASWNTVPGEILSVIVPTSREVAPGSTSRIWLDPALTWFVDPEGDLLPFELEDGELEFADG